jgi:hypothetical protein
MEKATGHCGCGRGAFDLARRRSMKYALFVYDAPGSWHSLATEQKHALHDEYHEVAASSGVIGHYRLRPPNMTRTIRVQDGETIEAEGPLAQTRENLRAIYLLETDDQDSALALATRIPAIRMGGAVEVWPLTERDSGESPAVPPG